jgi:Arc/MetJ-type ribon-helix-helix transcriptional regulator
VRSNVKAVDVVLTDEMKARIEEAVSDGEEEHVL